MSALTMCHVTGSVSCALTTVCVRTEEKAAETLVTKLNDVQRKYSDAADQHFTWDLSTYFN